MRIIVFKQDVFINVIMSRDFEDCPPDFLKYATAAARTGITCGVQERSNEHGFMDLVLVVPLGNNNTMTCFNVESGTWNSETYREVQVPQRVFFAMLRMLKDKLQQHDFESRVCAMCVEKITSVLLNNY